MEFLQLTYFCKAAENENFSTTAKEFGVPASDISQSIKRLENELGCQLFTRQANRVTLNSNGRTFYRKVRTALSILEDAKNELADDGVSGSIRIAININRRLAMQTIEKFRRLYPKVHLTVKHSVHTAFSEFDLIICASDLKSLSFASEALLSEEMMLAVHKDNPLASQTVIHAADLAAQPFICMDSESGHSLTETIGQTMGFHPHIVIRGDDPFYIRRCVELGLGIAFIPSISWNGQFSGDVVLRHLGPFFRTTYVCYDPKKHLRGCTQKFLEMLRTEYRQAAQTTIANHPSSPDV